MGKNQSKPQSRLVLFEAIRVFNELSTKHYVISTIELRLHAFVERSGIFGQVSIDKVRIKVQFKDDNVESKLLTWLQFQELIDLLAYIRDMQLEIKISQSLELNSDQDQNICPICFQSPKKIALTCGHSYCDNCVADWFIVKNRDTCPMCRDVNKINRQNNNYYMANDEEVLQASLKRINDLVS